MFAKSVKLFRIFGFEVRLDISWLLLALLIAWSTANDWFKPRHPDLSAGVLFALGVAYSRREVRGLQAAQAPVPA